MNENKGMVVFLAHWVENWNFLLWFFPVLHRRPKLKIFFLPLWPICAIMSVVYLLGIKAFDVVDRFSMGGVHAQTWLIRSMAWSFMLGFGRMRIKQRILEAVIAAQNAGASVIGLGALTKAEWLTKGGQWIVEELGDDLKIPVIHGDTLTAGAVIKRTAQVRSRFGIESPVFITGATSKIGRAVVLFLARKGVAVKMYTESAERFEEIRTEAGEFGNNIIHARSLKDGKDCTLWLTGKSKPSGQKLLSAIPSGAFVINFSVPNPLGEGEGVIERNIRKIEGGLMAYNPDETDLHFTMRLDFGRTYACHAATVSFSVMKQIMAERGEEWHNEVGPVRLDALGPAWKAAKMCGFTLTTLPALEMETSKSSIKTWVGELARTADSSTWTL